MHKFPNRDVLGLAVALCLAGCQGSGPASRSDAGSGGQTASGGAPSAGGGVGAGAGGVVGSGGASLDGGAFARGGVTGSGGTTGSGGVTGSGGTTGSGGATGSGGTTGSGGAMGSGGASGSGGTAGHASDGGPAGGAGGSGGIVDAGICPTTGLPPEATACTTDADCEIVANYTCCVSSYHGLAKAAPQYRACYNTTPVTGCTTGCLGGYVADDNTYVASVGTIPYVYCQAVDGGTRNCRTTFGTTTCPAQQPGLTTACSGTLACQYGQSTCCGIPSSATTCTCQHGTFSCAPTVECNFLCPDASQP